MAILGDAETLTHTHTYADSQVADSEKKLCKRRRRRGGMCPCIQEIGRKKGRERYILEGEREGEREGGGGRKGERGEWGCHHELLNFES